MKTLLRSTGAQKTRKKIKSKLPVLHTGNNFINPNRWVSNCTNCMNRKSIVHAFVLANGKILLKECESCFSNF